MFTFNNRLVETKTALFSEMVHEGGWGKNVRKTVHMVYGWPRPLTSKSYLLFLKISRYIFSNNITK